MDGIYLPSNESKLHSNVYERNLDVNHITKAVSLCYYTYFHCIRSNSEFWTAFCIIILIFYNTLGDVKPCHSNKWSSDRSFDPSFVKFGWKKDSIMYVDHCHQFVSSLLSFGNLLLLLFSKDINLDWYVHIMFRSVRTSCTYARSHKTLRAFSSKTGVEYAMHWFFATTNNQRCIKLVLIEFYARGTNFGKKINFNQLWHLTSANAQHMILLLATIH